MYALKKAGHDQPGIAATVAVSPSTISRELRRNLGDWEIDLVMGRPRTGALVSVVERRSRYTVLGKVGSKQAEQAAKGLGISNAP